MVGAPSYGESWIRPCININKYQWNVILVVTLDFPERAGRQPLSLGLKTYNLGITLPKTEARNWRPPWIRQCLEMYLRFDYNAQYEIL